MENTAANRLDLSPARWIWAPYRRTIPNTFVLFKRTIRIDKPVRSARGMITACSRYTMHLNGSRIQFGPAPCDPRYEEADPFDLTALLRSGTNELLIRVVYYGYGEGTWVSGRAGLLYRMTIEYEDGSAEMICSDENTLFAPDEAHPAGQYKRWYLRALQEEYDARKEPVEFAPSKVLPGRADKPSSLNGNTDYLYDSYPTDPDACCLRARSIAMPREEFVPAISLAHADIFSWQHSPEDWYRFGREDCFTPEGALSVCKNGEAYTADVPEGRSVAMTFRMPEGACGFIDFEIDAPEGTIVEANIQEGHDPGKTHWLDNHFYGWTRFICKEGHNHFVSFDYESFAWLQLHIRGTTGRVTVSNPGMLRRISEHRVPDWDTDDECVNKVLRAVDNTLCNGSIETFVDGMTRERQQYSGDCQHSVDLFGYLNGADHNKLKRFYTTYSEGLSKDGYFISSWPAYDGTNRLAQVQTGMTAWPIIIDHSFILAAAYCRWRYESGDHSLDDVMLPRFLKVLKYLDTLPSDGILLETARTGNTFFWLDPVCYPTHGDKKFAGNLLIVNMLESLSPVFAETGRQKEAVAAKERAAAMRQKLIADFYDPDRKLVFDNRETGTVSDYTLGLAVLLDILPDNTEAARVLREEPPFLKIAYPANAVWRIRALGKLGDCAAITKDMHGRWSEMTSLENNTLQESWKVEYDGADEWSHCPLSPGLAMYECYMGVRCEAEGFRRFSVCPQSGGLKRIRLTLATASGDLHFLLENGTLTLTFPDTMTGFIRLKDGTAVEAVSGKAVRIEA